MIKFSNLLRKESPEAVQDRLLCKAVLAEIQKPSA